MNPQVDTSLDLLLADCELSRRARFFPLGFPVDVETNSADVFEAAAEAWADFEPRFDEAPLRIALRVSKEGEMPVVPEPRYAVREHLITSIWDQYTLLTSDLRGGFSFGCLPRLAATDHAFVRYRFLQAAAMNMIVHRYLAPIHGAFVARSGIGVILCGDSFAGKSTLAYACARAGWTYLTDDGTYLVRSRQDSYAVANPFQIRLRDDAATLFPELKDHEVTVRPNRKIGVEVSTRERGFATAGGCFVAHVVFLNRTRGARARLVPYSKSAAGAWLDSYVRYGEESVREEQRQTLRRLLEGGVWEMRYGEAADAVQCLERLASGERWA